MPPFQPARICCFPTKLHTSTTAKPREAFGSARSRPRAVSAQRPPLHPLAEHDLTQRPAADSLTAAHPLGLVHRTGTTVPERAGDCAQCPVAPARLHLVDHLLLALTWRGAPVRGTAHPSHRRVGVAPRPSDQRIPGQVSVASAGKLLDMTNAFEPAIVRPACERGRSKDTDAPGE
jgi:hypothetical protein